MFDEHRPVLRYAYERDLRSAVEVVSWRSTGRLRNCLRRTLYEGKTKTEASAQAIPIPEDIQPIIEAWREVCPDTSPDALMFSDFWERGARGRDCSAACKEFRAVENSFDRKETWHSNGASHVSGDASNLGNGSTAVRNDERMLSRFFDTRSIRTTANPSMQRIPVSIV